MQKWIFLLLAVFFLSGKEPVIKSKAVFGVRISISGNSGMYVFEGRRYDSNGMIRDHSLMTKDDFIRFASGEWPSIFNPKRENFFQKYQIFGGVEHIDSFNIKVPYCPAIDSLWKIRFNLSPFKGGMDFGWANNGYGPSLAQKKYLSDRYQVKNLDGEFFVDTCLWMLLKDVRDSLWIADYKLKK